MPESIMLLPVRFSPNLPPDVVAEIFPPKGWVSALWVDACLITAKMERIEESAERSED